MMCPPREQLTTLSQKIIKWMWQNPIKRHAHSEKKFLKYHGQNVGYTSVGRSTNTHKNAVTFMVQWANSFLECISGLYGHRLYDPGSKCFQLFTLWYRGTGKIIFSALWKINHWLSIFKDAPGVAISIDVQWESCIVYHPHLECLKILLTWAS